MSPKYRTPAQALSFPEKKPVPCQSPFGDRGPASLPEYQPSIVAAWFGIDRKYYHFSAHRSIRIVAGITKRVISTLDAKLMVRHEPYLSN
jgi:hypothetical protein